MTNKEPKILLYDIETAPNMAAVWGVWEQNAVWVEKEWHMMSFAYKWLGDKGKAKVLSLPMYKGYKNNPEDDKELITELHRLMNEADVVIGHNADKFDNRKANARFLKHGLMPPSPYKTIDTLKVARRYFKLNKNHLNDLGEYLGVGKKVETGGYKLWRDCMAGDEKSWKLMEKYNIQDVDLLESVYLKLRPWITGHPSLAILKEDVSGCPKCGSHNMQRRGFAMTSTMRYQKYQCQDCGGWSRKRLAEKGQERPEFTN